MIITNAKYVSDIDANETPSIVATINDKVVYIPTDPANRHYQEIMALVESGELTIEPADELDNPLEN